MRLSPFGKTVETAVLSGLWAYVIALVWLLVLGGAVMAVGIGLAFGAMARSYSYCHGAVKLVNEVAVVETNHMLFTSSILSNASHVLQSVTIANLNTGTGALADAALELNSTAHSVHRTRSQYAPLAASLLQALRVTTYTLGCCALLLLLLASLLVHLRKPKTLLAMVALGWLLAAWAWVWVGVAFTEARLLHYACHLAHDFVQHPATSQLAGALPCDSLARYIPVLEQEKLDISNFTPVVNQYVSLVRFPLPRALCPWFSPSP
eukprot:jgi/Mesen1/198/ME1137855C07653